MKAVCLSFSVFIGFFIIYLAVRNANGQYFQDPSLTYQNITFDMANRGSYNTSDCLFDMLQCWEAVKPDMICHWWRWYSSICGVMRDYCAESYGDQENYSELFNMVQGMCWSSGDQYWT